MGEENLVPMNVWEELTPSYFLSCVSTIMLRFLEIMIMGAYHQTDKEIKSTPAN